MQNICNLPSPIKNWSLFYLSQSQWNVLPRCKFGYTCKMSNAVDWPAMRGVFSCVTQYQLIILNERTQYQLIISNGRDHSHRIDRSDRFKQDKSRAEKLSIQFWRDKIFAGRSFSNQFDGKYSSTPPADLTDDQIKEVMMMTSKNTTKEIWCS